MEEVLQSQGWCVWEIGELLFRPTWVLMQRYVLSRCQEMYLFVRKFAGEIEEKYCNSHASVKG